MIKLKSKRLEIIFEEPGERYCGPRYDWSSFITEIILDNKHQLLGVESTVSGPSYEGKGLCGEFCMDKPLGYDEARVGDFCMKIGVGLLQKKDEMDYFFADTFNVQPVAWDMTVEDNSINLFCRQELVNGFAYNLYKQITLEENALLIDYTLTNTGHKAIATSEYSHNFFCFNNRNINAEYELIVDFASKLNMKDRRLTCKNGVFLFEKELLSSSFCSDVNVCNGQVGSWTLTNKVVGVSVKESLSKPIKKFAIFAKPKVFCPEIFVDIKVDRGERFSWQRKWTVENDQVSIVHPN